LEDPAHRRHQPLKRYPERPRSDQVRQKHHFWHILLLLSRIRSDANSRWSAAWPEINAEVVPLICGNAPVTEMMMAAGSTLRACLAGALSVGLLAVTGITNKSLRALMTGLLGDRPDGYGMNPAGYDLTRLRRNGLIVRVEGRNPLPTHRRRPRLRDLLQQGLTES
jgi:hypothetical protein